MALWVPLSLTTWVGSQRPTRWEKWLLPDVLWALYTHAHTKLIYLKRPYPLSHLASPVLNSTNFAFYIDTYSSFFCLHDWNFSIHELPGFHSSSCKESFRGKIFNPEIFLEASAYEWKAHPIVSKVWNSHLHLQKWSTWVSRLVLLECSVLQLRECLSQLPNRIHLVSVICFYH